MSTVITINNVSTLIEPTKMLPLISDLYSDSSSRSAETGDMMLYPIRYNNYSIELEFVGNAAEIKAVKNAINCASGFPVTFLDETNTEDVTPWSPYVTRYMYASDRQQETLGTPNSRKYRLTFTLVESSR